jgi:hypothetical protein
MAPRHEADRKRDSRIVGGSVHKDETLVLWRALVHFRSGKRPACAPRGRPPRSACPLFNECPRWEQGDDRLLSLDENVEDTEQRRALWPCSRLLDLLDPDVNWFGRRRGRSR